MGNLLTEFSNWLIMAGYIRVAQTKGLAGGGSEMAPLQHLLPLVRPHFELME